MVCWTTFALLEAGVTHAYHENQQQVSDRERTENRPGMLNVSHLNLKKTSQLTKANKQSNPSATPDSS
jgi:hypothetical protein